MAYDHFGDKIAIEDITISEVRNYLKRWDHYVRSQTFGDVVKIMDGEADIR